MLSNTVVKGLGVFLAAGIASEVIYRMYLWFKARQCKTESRLGGRSGGSPAEQNVREVLFFPDNKIACKAFFTETERCSNPRCRFTHEKNSLSKLYTYLSKAQSSLDVCVFTICCQDLGDILISALKKGVRLRVICDDEQVDISGSQIWRLRSEGVQVRMDDSSYLMHHKFVLVDGKLLINGSFNWTRQAISGNQENLMVTDDPHTVQRFKAEYEKLWDDFDPRKKHTSELHKLDRR